MKRIPLKYKTEERQTFVKLTSRADKLGNILYFVEYADGEYSAFRHMSSALDFISTNFKSV